MPQDEQRGDRYRAHSYQYNHRPGPGRINLLISGFYRQSLVSTDDVIEAIEAIPSNHIKGLQVVKYDPAREVQQLMAQADGVSMEPHVMGAYYYASDLAGIVIYEFHNKLMFYHMLYHEIGHYVYLRVLTQPLRDEWLYRVRPHANQRFVSRYAATSAAEDFAECYAYFCVFPQTLWKIFPKMRFIAEKVFYLEPGSYDFSEPDPAEQAPPHADPDVPPAYPDIE